MATYLQGRFTPKYPQKYIGNPNNIIYRSSWERIFMKWADENPNVLSYSSEELHIPYLYPIDGKIHRYFPDFIITIKDKNDKIQTWMIEIKPYAQTIHPGTKKHKPGKKLIRETLEYTKNQAKWTAASAYCADKGWSFKILTEKDLGIK